MANADGRTRLSICIHVCRCRFVFRMVDAVAMCGCEYSSAAMKYSSAVAGFMNRYRWAQRDADVDANVRMRICFKVDYSFYLFSS